MVGEYFCYEEKSDSGKGCEARFSPLRRGGGGDRALHLSVSRDLRRAGDPGDRALEISFRKDMERRHERIRHSSLSSHERLRHGGGAAARRAARAFDGGVSLQGCAAVSRCRGAELRGAARGHPLGRVWSRWNDGACPVRAADLLPLLRRVSAHGNPRADRDDSAVRRERFGYGAPRRAAGV